MMKEHHTLLIKMAIDVSKKVKVVANLDHLLDVELLLGLSCVLLQWKQCITLSSLGNYGMFLFVKIKQKSAMGMFTIYIMTHPHFSNPLCSIATSLVE
jgi:hypothetical protein